MRRYKNKTSPQEDSELIRSGCTAYLHLQHLDILCLCHPGPPSSSTTKIKIILTRTWHDCAEAQIVVQSRCCTVPGGFAGQKCQWRTRWNEPVLLCNVLWHLCGCLRCHSFLPAIRAGFSTLQHLLNLPITSSHIWVFHSAAPCEPPKTSAGCFSALQLGTGRKLRRRPCSTVCWWMPWQVHTEREADPPEPSPRVLPSKSTKPSLHQSNLSPVLSIKPLHFS